MVNVVVLVGELARPGEVVVLASGERLATLDLVVRRPGRPAEGIPVRWLDPPGWVASLAPGTPLAISGRVCRRFFRSGGATQSRTEVVADRVVRGASRGRVRALVDEAVEALDAALAGEWLSRPAPGRPARPGA
jgi:single-strand DNA-binding protein